jgi:ATP-dependent protease ClpP protease subunit
VGQYIKEDIDRWSHETGESGTDCQMSEFFLKAIIHLNQISSKPIFVHMNNLGGDWHHGMSIYDAIRASTAHVYGICWGHAMSMGSIIIQACDSRIVAPHCTFMIHDGSEAITGSCKTVEAWAKTIPKSRMRMYEIYFSRMKAAKPRITIRKIEEMCSHDNIFAAEQAVDQGLADWVLETLNDPYKYHATEKPNDKWQSGMKLGKHETEEEEESE